MEINELLNCSGPLLNGEIVSGTEDFSRDFHRRSGFFLRYTELEGPHSFQLALSEILHSLNKTQGKSSYTSKSFTWKYLERFDKIDVILHTTHSHYLITYDTVSMSKPKTGREWKIYKTPPYHSILINRIPNTNCNHSWNQIGQLRNLLFIVILFF